VGATDYKIRERQRLNQRLWERDGGICGICGLPVDLADVEPDHVVQRMVGGSDDESNLRAAHRICNARRGKLDQLQLRPSKPVLHTCPVCEIDFWEIPWYRYCSNACSAKAARRRRGQKT